MRYYILLIKLTSGKVVPDLLWIIQFLISFNLLKDFSKEATVTGRMKNKRNTVYSKMSASIYELYVQIIRELTYFL